MCAYRSRIAGYARHLLFVSGAGLKFVSPRDDCSFSTMVALVFRSTSGHNRLITHAHAFSIRANTGGCESRFHWVRLGYSESEEH